MVGVRAHLGEIDLWYAIVIDIVPVSFHPVRNMITVAIIRVGFLSEIHIPVLRVRRLSGLRFHRRTGREFRGATSTRLTNASIRRTIVRNFM